MDNIENKEKVEEKKNCFKLSSPIKYRGKEITEITLKPKITGRDIIIAERNVNAEVKNPGPLETTLHIVAVACGIDSDTLMSIKGSELMALMAWANNFF